MSDSTPGLPDEDEIGSVPSPIPDNDGEGDE